MKEIIYSSQRDNLNQVFERLREEMENHFNMSYFNSQKKNEKDEPILNRWEILDL